jgi:hypothetical protein
VKNIHLVRDYLDDQLVDVKGRRMGRIDGMTLDVRQRKPPRVQSFDVGTPVLAARISNRLAGWFLSLGRRVGSEPLHIDPKHIKHAGIDIRLDVDAEDCGAWVWEDWLREQVVRRLPGSGL